MAKSARAARKPAPKSSGLPEGQNEELVGPKMAIRLEFGRRFRQAMLDKGVRQIDVANATDIGRDSISGYTRGRVLPEGDNLRKICKFLDTTPEKLVPHYGIDTKAVDHMPALEIQQANAEGKVWLRVNQVVSLEQVSRIMAILQEKT